MSKVQEMPRENQPGSPGELEVLATARLLATDEFERAERFDRKALNLATVVGAFYSLSQIVVFGAFGTEDLVPSSWNSWLLAVGLAATASAALAVGAAVLVFRARKEVSGPIDRLKPWLAAIRRNDPRVIEQLVLTYETIADSRRKTNSLRTRWYRAATWLAFLAVALTAAELAMLLIAIT